MSAAPFSSPGPDDEGQSPDVEVGQVSEGNALALRADAQVPTVLQAASVAAAAGAKAAIEARFQIAQLVPRDNAEVERRVLAMCDDPLFADEALWSKPQGATEIEGISIRFAEEYVQEAGNFHVASTVTWDDDRQRTIKVEVTDLQRNNSIPVDVVVEKTVERYDTKGREVLGSRLTAGRTPKRIYRVRATEDEVLMKQNSAVSKAFRTGVDRLIPRNLRAKAIERIKATIKAAALKDLPGTVKKALAAFATLNVPQDELEEFLGHRVQTMTVEEYEHLRAILQGIKDGEFTWESVTKRGAKPQPKQRPVSAVRDEGYETKQEKPAPAAPKGDAAEADDRELDRQLVENEGRS